MAPERTILDGAAVVTMDGARTEHATGHVVIENGRIATVGPGRAPLELAGTRIDVTGCLVTPGLVKTHHHLYQWVTRGLAIDDGLFGWLTTLYPVWGGINQDIVASAAAAGLARLARTGCTTSTDHHYIFPADGGDLLGAEISAARRVGLRFMPTRGSMDLGRSDGGLPPDHVVEDVDAILTASAAAIDTHHDPGPDSMLRIGLAPCSPFSVTEDLLCEAAALARDKAVRLHTHLAETLDEEEFCLARFGRSPVDYLETLGWLGDDVWLAHGIHFDDPAIKKLAVRDALKLATIGGARLLGWADQIGSLEPGKQADIAVWRLDGLPHADIAVWRLDGLPHADIADPVAALVLGEAPPLELLMVGGRTLAERDRVVTVDEDELTRSALRAHRYLLARASTVTCKEGTTS